MSTTKIAPSKKDNLHQRKLEADVTKKALGHLLSCIRRQQGYFRNLCPLVNHYFIWLEGPTCSAPASHHLLNHTPISYPQQKGWERELSKSNLFCQRPDGSSGEGYPDSAESTPNSGKRLSQHFSMGIDIRAR